VIDFKDDTSQLNLWKVLINLDFHFGTEEETKNTFRAALGGCDHLQLCQHMIGLYVAKGMWETAEGFAVLSLKKSNRSPQAWADYIKFLYEWRKATTDTRLGGQLDEKIVDTSKRALQSIYPNEHKFFLMKRAGTEFKVGEIEKGRTTLETLLSKYPSKGDIWNLYLDMECKYGEDLEVKRNLFQRACRLNLKPKVMKGLFTKWLDFEQKNKDNKKIAEVKALAAKYIERCMSKIVNDDDEDEENERENNNKEDDEVEV